MNNEPQASQETLGDTSQTGSVTDSNVAIIKHAKKILLVLLTLFVFIETIRREIETAAEDSKCSMAINLQSVLPPPSLSNKTNNV